VNEGNGLTGKRRSAPAPPPCHGLSAGIHEPFIGAAADATQGYARLDPFSVEVRACAREKTQGPGQSLKTAHGLGAVVRTVYLYPSKPALHEPLEQTDFDVTRVCQNQQP
jgi:hypothetical protein